MRICHPDQLPFESLAYLKKAADKNPLLEDPDIWSILNDCRKGHGEIYIWDTGAMYVEYLPEMLHVSLLGASNLQDTKDQISGFLKDLMKSKNIKYLTILGRASWHKMFTELKPVGTFYMYEGGKVPKTEEIV